MSETNRISIGIDGGGSGSRYAVYDHDSGSIDIHFGPPLQTAEQSAEEIEDVLRKQMDKIGRKPAQIIAGLAGLYASGKKELYEENISRAFGTDAVFVSDAEAAYYHNFGSKPRGCLVMSGTGSVIILEKAGNLIPFGGLGPQAHETLSGRSMGKKALELFGYMLDVNPDDPVCVQFSRHLSVDDRNGLIKLIGPSGINPASVLPLVFDAARSGHSGMSGLVAYELNYFHQVISLINSKYPLENIILHGGLFKNFWFCEKVKAVIYQITGKLPIFSDGDTVAASLARCTDPSRLLLFRT